MATVTVTAGEQFSMCKLSFNLFRRIKTIHLSTSPEMILHELIYVIFHYKQILSFADFNVLQLSIKTSIDIHR